MQATFNENREEKLVPVALLFSGGLDSMILAALLDECLDARCKLSNDYCCISKVDLPFPP